MVEAPGVGPLEPLLGRTLSSRSDVCERDRDRAKVGPSLRSPPQSLLARAAVVVLVRLN